MSHGTFAGEPFDRSGLDRSFIDRSLFGALIDCMAANPDRPVLEDQQRQPLTLRRLMLGACVLGRRIAALTPGERCVGLLMPNVNGAAVAFFALHAYGRIPAMLNFTAGQNSLSAALAVGGIRTVLTSRQFVATMKLEETVAALSASAKVFYLEDLRKELSAVDKAIGAAYARFPGVVHRLWRRAPQDVAVLLFTSGTEGAPKGVALSSANILANVAQILHLYRFDDDDKFFNALPLFHSYGLTAGFLLPLLAGLQVFIYPSPLHYKQIPGLVRDSRATVLLSTDTFAAGWARSADEGDFNGIRMTFLGAERVKEQTRALWMERFGVVLNEGYGATECAPVLAVNYPARFRPGTVGCLLPGIEARLDPVPGLDTGGRLYVRGPNTMIGYYDARRDPPLARRAPDEWYDTGDIVSIDADGFVAILGRAKRFAKIGGEMVSLAAVEAYAAALWPEQSHAVVSVPDARKGEALVLVTDSGEATVEALIAYAQQHGIAELSIPKRIVKTYSLPMLGTGKIDLAAIETMARSAG